MAVARAGLAGLQSLRARAYARLLAGNGPGTLPAWVPEHCLAVEGLAAAMVGAAQARGLPVDAETVHAGAILHDIGRSVTQDVRHASAGSELLRRDPPRHETHCDRPAWDDAVILCVERHTGGGIDATEAAALGLPVRDYTPRTLEERIVCHADNLFTGPRRLALGDLRAKYEGKGLAAAWTKIERLHRSLAQELGVDLGRLEPQTLPVPAMAPRS